MPKSPLLYRKPTGESQAAEEERKRKLQKKQEAIFHNARKCLNHPDFKKYREAYEKAEQELIHEIINYVQPDGDPVKYALEMAKMTTKLRDAGNLLRAVKRNASPRKAK